MFVRACVRLRLQERRRARALLHVQALYQRRVPEVEQADTALADMLSAFSTETHGG